MERPKIEFEGPQRTCIVCVATPLTQGSRAAEKNKRRFNYHWCVPCHKFTTSHHLNEDKLKGEFDPSRPSLELSPLSPTDINSHRYVFQFLHRTTCAPLPSSRMAHRLVFSLREEIIGLAPPPPGLTPNFHDPPSIRHLVLIINITCPLLSAIFVALRLYTTGFILRSVGIDDCKHPVVKEYQALIDRYDHSVLG